MKVKRLIEMLEELNVPDYEMNFSQYLSIVVPTDTTSEEYFVVTDDPIVGFIHNDDSHEVRLFTQTSEERIIKQIESGKEWKEFK